jgi:hypothetical protein
LELSSFFMSRATAPTAPITVPSLDNERAAGIGELKLVFILSSTDY